jgi:hypothetical protein
MLLKFNIMKKLLLFCTFLFSLNTFAQPFNSLGEISAGNTIYDLTYKGNTMYAAMGIAGVFKSVDEGITWTPTGVLPNLGFGDEAAFSLLVASNGDIIAGGNALYNGAELSGIVFRSSDDGATWSGFALTGLTGYERSGKIIELPGGNLMMQGGNTKFFTSNLSITNWTQVTSPGGVIRGFHFEGNNVLVMNNPAGGTAGLWYSNDLGTTWDRYGTNGTNLDQGTVVLAPMVTTTNYKFIGTGGASGDNGIFRAGNGDTSWVSKNNGITNTYYYPTCLATDNTTIWMIFEGISQCYLTSTTDFGENWSTPVGGQPHNSVGTYCMEKLVPFSTNLYGYTDSTLWQIPNVVSTLGINQNVNQNSSILIFPNPASSVFSVDSYNIERQLLQINIYNINGALVKALFLEENQRTVNIENLINGIYIVEIKSEQSTVKKKLIIKK